MAYYLDHYRTHRKKSPFRKFLMYFLLLLILGGGVVAWQLYTRIFESNVWIKDGGSLNIDIPTGSDFETVKNLLYEKGLVVDRKAFEWLARQKSYDARVKPGRYRIRHGMNNLNLVKMLQSGQQEPVRLIFNNIRTRQQLAGRIANQIEADSISIDSLLTDPGFLARYNLNTANAVSIFIPNTYELWWNTSAGQFIDRMVKEYEKFWDSTRIQKATALGMDRTSIITLASIIEQETNRNDEKARMAGVYLNRLRLSWPLQADPTLKFALGDFGIRRILHIHKEIESPYNTYKYAGLPPGPICIPGIASIDAVLNYEKNNYLFFCARDDMSGYHVFTASYEQHLANAAKYQQALNRLKIYK